MIRANGAAARNVKLLGAALLVFLKKLTYFIQKIILKNYIEVLKLSLETPKYEAYFTIFNFLNFFNLFLNFFNFFKFFLIFLIFFNFLKFFKIFKIFLIFCNFL